MLQNYTFIYIRQPANTNKTHTENKKKKKNKE